MKHFFNQGTWPPLYYIRTGAGLEIDLLIEPAAGTLVPVEIKLSGTPTPSLARGLTAFHSSFAALAPAPGLLICLIGQETLPLTRNATALGLDHYLQKLAGISEPIMP